MGIGAIYPSDVAELGVIVDFGRVYVGTSGWSYTHWRGSFYETKGKSKDYLAVYAEHFRTAEVNNTFYQLPSRETLCGWRDAVPDDFVFAVKASRYMTHMKKLKDPEEPVARLFDRIDVLGDKLGPILVQLPPNWRKNSDRLAYFLKALPNGHRFALEFRDRSWFDLEVYDLLREHQAALCIYDVEGWTSPAEMTADWTYVRFHKPTGEHNWHYGRETLAEWADAFCAWAGDGRDVYCYFNNDIDVAAPENARQMIELLAERGVFDA